MKTISKYPFKFTVSLLAFACLAYAVFELSAPFLLNQQEDFTPAIQNSLDNAEQLFNEVTANFENQSDALFNTVLTDIRSNQNRLFIHNRFANYNFWGTTIYRNGNLWVWDNFQLRPATLANGDDENEEQVHTSVVNYNNVILLHRQQQFAFEDTSYTFITAQRLAQTTNLPFTEFVTYSLSDHSHLKGGFPVSFAFLNPPPDEIEYRKLSTSNADSVGIVYARLDDLTTYKETQNLKISLWRSLGHSVIFLLLFFTAIQFCRQKRSFLVHLIQIFLIILIWLILFQTDLIEYWANTFSAQLQFGDLLTAIQLTSYIIHTFFLVLLWISIHHTWNYFMDKKFNENHFITFTSSILFGAFCVFLFLFFLITTQVTLVESNIPMLDLELAPNASSFLFYITASVFFTGIIGLIISTGYYLFISVDDKSAITSVLSIVSFLAFFYLADLMTDQSLFFSWIFLLSGLLFLISLITIHSLHKYPEVYSEMSGFRKLMIITFLASVTIYTIIWSSSNSRMDRLLVERIEAFTTEETIDTDQVLFNLLEIFESTIQALSQQQIEENPGSIQAQFQQVAQSIVRDNWKNHSFDLQLLSPGGDLLGSYSTNIDPPGWSPFFETDLMLRTYRGERLRQQTNRPVVWANPPTNLPERYTTFARGWIPIYDTDTPNNIVAWLAGDAYIERPDLNKPMRAVLSAATPENWKQSYYIAEFLGNRLTRSKVEGLYNNQPQYNKLPEREAVIAESDSIAFITNITTSGSFREVLIQKEDRKILKASTPIPPLNQHLFSFVRLQIIVVFFGLFVFSMLAMSGFHNFILFGQSRKFKHRLIDGLTLASILFLTVLIFATQYAVGVQNEKNVERELINKLNSLGESLRGDLWTPQARDTQTYLAELTTSLNVDAMIYNRATVSESTTPQIFQQYLMPGIMPFPAYDFLYNRERRHYFTTSEIGDEKLLIGYRAILDEDARPVSAVAIPTFLQSPVYREQLLETTSYLFVVYLAIFGLFIIGSVFLSSQLTKPLKVIQKGLNKISRGESKTEVAVTSRDEIGSLASAYNQMVLRLDEAQRELIKAERESAWKEMAQQVAHEIKNPLTPMKLNLQHLQRQLENNPENVLELKPVIEKTAANIIDQIESLNKIASDFSKFAKPVQSSLEKVDLNKLIKSVADLYSHDESITISVNGYKKQLFVNASQDDFKRALINLVKNGIEACGESDAQITISLQKKKSAVFVSIQDNGSGIEPDNKEKIFVPNFSTKSSGTGLGLAITKKIIEAHEGEIWFKSDHTKGTTFFIKLPLLN